MLNWQFDETKNTLFLQGRMDAQTSASFEKELAGLVSRGKRDIFIDCSEVKYMSSAGMRVFLTIQKQLKPISGGLVLVRPSDAMLKVFKLAGFHKLFEIILGDDDQAEQKQPQREQRTLRGIPFECATQTAKAGTWSALTSKKDAITAFYDDGDAYAINANHARFGYGLSAPGESFAECKDLLGECVVVNGNYFYYPAIKNAAVDFVLAQEASPDLHYQFMTGGLFDGTYAHALAFGMDGAERGLGDLLDGLGELVETNLFGVIGVLESAGIWGMNFKKTPIAEHFPATGSMKDRERFAEFMDFPIEASFRDHVIVAVGLVCKDKQRLSDAGQRMFPEESANHLHAVVFEKAPVSRNIDDFQGELERVIANLKPLKVQHLLQKSRFKGGLLGVVPVEEA